VTVHLKNIKLQNPAQVNGLVTILNGLLPPIWIGTTPTVMVKLMVLIISEISLDYMNLVMLTVTNPSTSVNITSVSSTTKTLGELLLVQKDIHKSGVIVHSKFMKSQNPAQVNGLVTILNGSLPPIWTGSTKMVMVKSMMLIISEILPTYMNLVIKTVIHPSTSVNITSVSSTTKTLGEPLLAQKDIHKSGVIVHLKFQAPAQVNGLVTISSISPLNT
jgi:hypothetical protein